jgi:hypothetical protein
VKHLLWVVTVAVVACKGGGDDKPAPRPATTIPAYPLVVKSDAVLPLAKLPRPTYVIWLDGTGAIEAAVAPKVWDGKLPQNRVTTANLDAIAEKVAPTPRPPPTREEAIEQARTGDPWGSRLRNPVILPAMVRGFERAPAVIATRDPEPITVLVMPHSRTPSGPLVIALEQLGGYLGVVTKSDEVGALRLVFHPTNHNEIDNEKAEVWVELHVGMAGIDVVSLPSNGQATVPWTKNTVDTKELTAVIRGFGKELPKLDVLVSPDVPAQLLVDTLIALDGLGVTVVGLGRIPGAAKGRAEAVNDMRRGRAGFHSATGAMQLLNINFQGDFTKPLIKEGVRAKMPELTACYDKALAKQPGLSGHANSQFFIMPDGKVASASASASGFDPEAGACMADVLETIQFPKPKGGGGVLVHFVFRFWPYET